VSSPVLPLLVTDGSTLLKSVNALKTLEFRHGAP